MNDRQDNAELAPRLLALALRQSLAEVPAYRYSLHLKGATPEQLHAHPEEQLVNGCARALARGNGGALVTSLVEFDVVSLAPLSVTQERWKDLEFEAKEPQSVMLRAAVESERLALERLLREDCRRACQALACRPDSKVRAKGGYLPQLIDIVPSQRVPIVNGHELLEVYQRLTLDPLVLPDGQALVAFDVGHEINPARHVTLSWILQHRPQWLEAIRRVRHRYRTSSGYAAAEFLGLSPEQLPHDRLPGLGKSLLEFHEPNLNPAEHLQAIRDPAVVQVRYGPDKPAFSHLPVLLAPIFTFETLQQIAPRLVAGIARRLPWSVQDRVKAAGRLKQGLRLAQFGPFKELPEVVLARCGRNVFVAPQLRFAQNRIGDTEQDVLQFGAYARPQRSRIIPVQLGRSATLLLSQHLKALKPEFERFLDPTQDLSKWTGVVRKPDEAAFAADLSKAAVDGRLGEAILLVGIADEHTKASLQEACFRLGLPAQFMRLDHPRKTYSSHYYRNLAAGLFSKAGGILCALGNLPGDTELFIGLDLGGVSQRVPAAAFLFTNQGVQLGWHIIERQKGERIQDQDLLCLLGQCLATFRERFGRKPVRIAIHRDGRFSESLEAVRAFEDQEGVAMDVLEVIKNGVPRLLRRERQRDGWTYLNPKAGDAFILESLGEAILATYGGDELGGWGRSVSIRPIRLRRRYGQTEITLHARQALMLSRIHGASLFRHPRLPVTTHHADRFATLRQQVSLDALVRLDRLCPIYL